MTAEAIVVRGRLTSPTTVELLEPLKAPTRNQEVQVVIPQAPDADGSRLAPLVQYLRSLPPGTRTKEEIDRQVQAERDDWE